MNPLPPPTHTQDTGTIHAPTLVALTLALSREPKSLGPYLWSIASAVTTPQEGPGCAHAWWRA
jgi:hypothetical protein